MHRTTIMIPRELRAQAMQRAREMGISLGALIREALESHLHSTAAPDRSDTLLSDDAVYTGEAPENLSAHHDSYLYGEDG